MGQDIFAVATDVLEAFAARTRMSILLCNDLRFTEWMLLLTKRKKNVFINEWMNKFGWF